jgi:peptide/nickel transport system substrate-binding protein
MYWALMICCAWAKIAPKGRSNFMSLPKNSWPKRLAFALLIVAVLVSGWGGPAAHAQAERVVRMASRASIASVDPAIAFDQASASLTRQLYDPLFRYVGSPPILTPWLADTLTISDDKLTYFVTVNSKATFADGSPVTAEAVVYSAQRMLRLGQAPASLFAGILSVEGVNLQDSQTVEFKLLTPHNYLADLLSWLYVVNPAVVEANKGDDDGVTYLSSNSAGSGPYTLSLWQPGSQYELTARPDYWRGWSNDAYPTRVVRQVVADTAARRAALERGEVDFVDGMNIDDLTALSTQAGITIAPGPTLSQIMLRFNSVTGPTADPFFRRAIFFALDYEALLGIWGNWATALRLKTRRGRLPERSLEAAKEQLAKSSSPDVTALVYTYIEGLEDQRRIGEIVKSSLADLGITVSLEAISWQTAFTLISKPETAPAMFPIYTGTALASIDYALWNTYHSSTAGTWGNPGHYGEVQTDELLLLVRQGQTEGLEFVNIERFVGYTGDVASIPIVTLPEDHVVGPRIVNYRQVYSPVMGGMEDFYFFQVAP